MKKCGLFWGLLFFVATAVFCQPAANSALSANRRTAIRYLQLAKQYASQKQWKEAESHARLGLAYDDTIADLWYVRAVSQFNAGEKKGTVLPLVVTSLTEAEWVDYNRDSARILYADLLSNMLRFDEAISVLDLSPFLYSADAEYIRAKCYYNKGGEAVQRAREKIDAARRIYPLDSRFAELFFTYEYTAYQTLLQTAASGLQTESLPPLVRKIADSFIQAVPQYDHPSAELELYAAIFAEGEKQERLFKSFKARQLNAPLYAEYAVRLGLLDQNAALDAFFHFADERIALSVVQSFVPLITETQPKQDIYEYFNAYSGMIFADTEQDGIENVSVTYARGRPAFIQCDADQDDEYDWTADCDFGVPVAVHLRDSALDVLYGNWPWIQTARYQQKADTSLDFNVVADTLRWTPFTLQPVASMQAALQLDFFFPVVQETIPPISALELLHASSYYTLPSQERPDALITVSVLDGVAQLARYSVHDTLYAQAHFENGIPTMRVVDADGDGLFETAEFYGFVADRNQTVHTIVDEMQVITNLFGAPAAGTGFYVRMIQIDTNGDTVPDFTEEYLEGEGKISSWDTDNDGRWDTRYIKHPKQADGVLREESLFHQPLTYSEVRVLFEDGVPVTIIEEPQSPAGNAVRRERSVTRTHLPHFYWIGAAGTDEDAQKILQQISQAAGQGVSVIAENKQTKTQLLGVRIGEAVFGEVLPELPPTEDDGTHDEKN